MKGDEEERERGDKRAISHCGRHQATNNSRSKASADVL